LKRKKVELNYLAGCRSSVDHHVSDTRDDVHSERDQEGANGRIDGPKERKRYGEEPHRQDHWHSRNCPQHKALCVVDPNQLLPHEVEWSDSKAHSDKLQRRNIKKLKILKKLKVFNFTSSFNETKKSNVHYLNASSMAQRDASKLGIVSMQM